jgi:site-specific DNA-methyltransferase (adenine-specific)
MPFAGAHFATFPEELARRCILAGSAAKACESCGAPWERWIEQERCDKEGRIAAGEKWGPMNLRGAKAHNAGNFDKYSGAKTDKGWQPTCACEANTGTAQSTVLDPFGGSGTTAAVATGHGRRAIYIDLNPEYLDLAEKRIGPMLCVRSAPVEAA